MRLHAVRVFSWLILCAAWTLCAQQSGHGSVAQAVPSGAASGMPAYTLHAGTRVVLTDVSVTDRDGNPVYGLKAEDFHILDNKQPQTLLSFEEHRGTALTPLQEVKAAPGVYSNAILEHLPPVVNVLVLDITNLRLPEQMYLNYELTRFVKSFPGGQPLAIFLWTGSECLVLQDFTADRALLMAAVKKGVPRFRSPDREYLTDIAALHQIALYLAPIPGRKNVLWFSGGSTLALLDPTQAPLVDMRPVYDELEADRIAIYPVDARGLTVGGGMGEGLQHLLMEDVADATGGRASYNNNGLDALAARLVDTDRSFYTLTYTPREFSYDGKWHRVKVEAGGTAYRLSYRHGYYADAVQTVPPRREGETRTRLMADGTRLKVPAENSAPILFEARLSPAGSEAGAVDRIEVKPVGQAVPPKKGKERVAISYSLPAAQFMLHDVNGDHRIEVGAAASICT